MFTAQALTDQNRMKAALLFFGGPRLTQLCGTLPELVKPEEGEEITGAFDIAVGKLNIFFKQRSSTLVEKIRFRQEKQLENETMDDFVTRLRISGKYCAFEKLEEEVAQVAIANCYSHKLRKRLLGIKELTIEAVLKESRFYEKIESDSKQWVANRENTHRDNVQVITTDKDRRVIFKKKVLACFNCGGEYPHKSVCPAKGKECRNCGKLNHFVKFCKSKQKKEEVSAVGGEEMMEQSENDYLFTVEEENQIDGYVFQVGEPERLPRRKIKIANTDISCLIDTGSTLNIIDEVTWNQMSPKPPLQTYTNKSFAYGHKEIEKVGVFKTTLQYQCKSIKAHVVVMRGNSGCLIGYNGSVALGLVEITCQIESESTIKDDGKSDYFKRKYPNVFSDKLGKLKNFELKLHIDKAVKPVIANPRNKPFHLRKAIEEQIERKLQLDIIEEVRGEPTEWLSETVVVPKPEGKVRMCTDMKAANVAIQRERFEMPNVEDIIYAANGKKFFSKIDLKDAYEQVVLSKESRYISRFRTHSGIFQYKRLFFGINAAPEIFHNLIKRILIGLEGVQNASDDVLIMSDSKEDDRYRCEEVFKRLESNGLTVNSGKCKFSQNKIEFFGLELSEKGVSLNEEKTKALKEFKVPKNASELASFLGLSVYASKWIPNLASMAEGLRKLSTGKERWNWAPHHQVTFDKIKNTLIKRIGFFKLDWNTELRTDGSPVGLGAELTQTNPNDDNDKQVIMYISRKLTGPEQRYSQIEIEALAIVWGCLRLSLYLVGRKFKIYTDNKALTLILNNPLSKPPARIRGWELRIAHFDMELVHIQGKGNIADFLSRHPLKEHKDEYDDSEAYINQVIDFAVPKSVTREELCQASIDDPVLTKLRGMIKSGIFRSDVDVKDFGKVFGELMVSGDNLILRENRIVVPEILVSRLIELAHEGHLGMMKTKQLLRSKVWFPKMDEQIEVRIKTCLACQAVGGSKSYVTPLVMSQIPEAPWTSVAIDFHGPIYPTREYVMVVICEYSRYPIDIIISSYTAKVVIERLERLFSWFGIPEVVKSDNGPPFTSNEFKQFAQYLGFKHRLITPYWPQANGLAEVFMKIINKVVQTAKIEGKPWKLALLKFLRNYRSTPHATTGKAPSVLMFRNGKTSRLISNSDFQKERVDQEAISKDKIHKEQICKLANKRLHAREMTLKIGDWVLVRQIQTNKSMSKFEPVPYCIIEIKGNMVTVQNESKTVTRNVSFMKKWEGEVVRNEVKKWKNQKTTTKQVKIGLFFENKPNMVQNEEVMEEEINNEQEQEETRNKEEEQNETGIDETKNDEQEQDDSINEAVENIIGDRACDLESLSVPIQEMHEGDQSEEDTEIEADQAAEADIEESADENKEINIKGLRPRTKPISYNDKRKYNKK